MSSSDERIMRLSTRCGFKIEAVSQTGGKNAARPALNRQADFRPTVSFQRHGEQVQNTDENRTVCVKNVLRVQRNLDARIRTSDKTRRAVFCLLPKQCECAVRLEETLRVHPANCREKTHRHDRTAHM